MAQWAQFMCERGVAEEAAVNQAPAVASMQAVLWRNNVEKLGPAVPEDAPASTELSSLRHTAVVPAQRDGQDDLADPLPSAPEATGQEMVDVPVVQVGTFLVSVQPRSRFHRLHRMGDCSYRPRVDYKTFKSSGPDEPAPHTNIARCKHCFRAQSALPPFGGASSSAASVESSTE